MGIDAAHYKIPITLPADDTAIPKLIVSVLSSAKGAGWAMRLLEQCQPNELPITAVEFLKKIYAYFPLPVVLQRPRATTPTAMKICAERQKLLDCDGHAMVTRRARERQNDDRAEEGTRAHPEGASSPDNLYYFSAFLVRRSPALCRHLALQLRKRGAGACSMSKPFIPSFGSC